MAKPVPRFIAEQFQGGAHGFRSLKRRQLDAVIKAFRKLRGGCAHFPGDGFNRVKAIEHELLEVRKLLRAREWGR